MLDFLYIDDITIKYNKVDDGFSDPTFSTKTIKGCLQSKTKQRVDGNGNIVVTDMLLFTKEQLQPSDIIVYERDRAISSIDVISNHLMGGVDHYEVRF